MLDAKKCLEIYEYCQKQYTKLEKKDGHYNPKHDKIVLDLASKEFKVDANTADRAFELVAKTISKNPAEQKTNENVERNIRKLLYNNISLQIR